MGNGYLVTDHCITQINCLLITHRRPTITSKVRGISDRMIGSANDFSESDILKLKRMYKCPEDKVTPIGKKSAFKK